MMRARELRLERKTRKFMATAERLGVKFTQPVVPPKPKEFKKYTFVASKVLADQVIFSPAYLALFLTGISLLQGDSVEDVKEKLKSHFVKALIADCVVWPPIQVINFWFVPVSLQPLFVNTVNLGWNSFLSWIAHAEDCESKKAPGELSVPVA
jgi:hypothetical protein